MSTAAPSKPTPESIRSKRFNTIFRGCDPHQVRTYLDEVAGGYATALAEITSLRAEVERLAQSASGEHAAALDQESGAVSEPDSQAIDAQVAADELLEAARREASSIVARANDEAARLILRARAESRGRPGADTLAVLEAAASETGDPEIAREQARVMIGEAKAVRERILTDLAKRRRVAHVQLEQMRVAREKLAESLREARRLVDEASRDLSMAEVEARIAAEAAARRVNAEPMPSSQELEAELLPGTTMTGATSRQVALSGIGTHDRSDVRSDADLADVAAIDVSGDLPDGTVSGDVLSGDVALGDVSSGDVSSDDTVDGAGGHGGSVAREAPNASSDAALVDAPSHHRPTASELESLFARVRAANSATTDRHDPEMSTPIADSPLPPEISVAELDATATLASNSPVATLVPVATAADAHDLPEGEGIGVVVDLTRHVAQREAQEAAEIAETDGAGGRQRHLHVVGEADPQIASSSLLTDELSDELSAELPDELPEVSTEPGADVVSLRGPGSEVQLAFVIGPLQSVLTRSVKRELQDAQSAALSAVRTSRSRPQLEAVLGAKDEQQRRLSLAIRPALVDAARAGADRAGRPLSDPESLVADLTDELCTEIAGAIRDEVQSDIDAAASGGLDSRSLTEMISTSFRHWTTERVGATTADYLRVAFEIGSTL